MSQLNSPLPGGPGRKIVVLSLIFILAVVVRIYALTAYPAAQVADAEDYQRLATSLAVDHQYVSVDGQPTAWRPPGYPLFLAGIYSVVGISEFKACVAQAFLGSFLVLIVMYLGLTLFGEKVALVSGATAALYPGLFYLPRLLLSENLAIVLLLLAVVMAIKNLQSEGVGIQVLLGAVLGISILVRGANVFTAAFLLGLILLRRRRPTRRARAVVAVKCAVPVILTMIVVLAPWAVRNYFVFRRPAPIATQAGIALYASYWPPTVGSKRIWGNLPGEEDPFVARAVRSGDEVAVSEAFERETVTRLAKDPLYFFRLWPSKLISFLAPFDWETFPRSQGATKSFNWGYLLIVAPALMGLWITYKMQVPEKWALLALPASSLIQTLIFYGSPRFRLTAEPIAIILAAAGLVWLLSAIAGFVKNAPNGFYRTAKVQPPG